MWQIPSLTSEQALVAILCVAAASLFASWSWRASAARRARQLPPGEMEWPIGGLSFFTKGFSHFVDFEGDGPRKMRLLGVPTALLRHPDHVKMVLNSDLDSVDVFWPPSTRALLGRQSIIAVGGAQHRTLRRLLGPSFAPQAIEAYLPAIQRICERYCANWAAATAEVPTAASRMDIDKLPKMQIEARLLTFEVMAQVVAGFDFTPQQLATLSQAFEDFMAGLFSPIPIAIPGTGFAKSVAARKVMVKALDEQIDRFKAAAAAAAKVGKGADAAAIELSGGNGGSATGIDSSSTSVMERLMEVRDDNGQPLSREAMQDLGITLLFAGHETTAGTIVRLLMRLRSRPDVLSRLRAEQLQAVDKHGERITGAALRDMPYLDAVVKEVWRLDPVVPVVPRVAVRDLRINGYDVPKGWRLFAGVGETVKLSPSLRDVPEGHPMDPRVFNPDRWMVAPAAGAAGGDASSECGLPLPPGMLSSPVGMLPPQMMTFGSGTRYCLGSNLAWAELKVFLAAFLRRYNYTAPLEHMDMKIFPSVTVTGGFPVMVRPVGSETVAAA